ncbi:hypothetical protein L3Q82_020065, partial [Scortum barcoo]
WTLETQLLERGWTILYSGVAQGERRRAGVGLLIAPQLSRHVLEFTPVNERVASLRLRVGDRVSCCCLFSLLCAYGPNSSTEYPGLLGVPGRGYLRVYGSLPNNQSTPVHMCFVDLEKAFDHRVPRGILWGVLHEYGIRGPLLS